MSTSRKPETKQRVRLAVHARKLARENAAVVVVLAIVTAVAVTAVFTRRVLAAKHEVRVLDCPVAGAVAHHHDESCFDENGTLVCPLPERDLHTHDESCYERRLVCETPEGAGAHHHDESCYDENGDLVCGQEESDGHRHDDSCYADVLVCELEECSEEHVHGDGCWRTVAANEDAVEATHPEQTFQHDVRDKDGKLQLRIDVEAPQGALPADATMDAVLLDANKLDLNLVQKALNDKVEQQRKAAEEDKGDGGILRGLHLFAGNESDGQDDALEAGKVLKWQALDVTFRDSEGNEVQPAKDVTVKLTSKLVQTADGHAVIRVEDEEEAARRASEQARELEAQGVAVQDGEGKVELEAQAIDQFSEGQLEEHRIKLDDNQVAFEADRSTTYVLATTSLKHEMGATDGSTVSIDVTASAEAGIPQDAVLDVKRVSPDSDEYGDYVARSVEAMGAERADVALASFFDIHIKDADGNEVQPKAPVDVKIELADIPDAPNGFAAVHFKATGEEGATELEQLECGGQDGTVTFEADSFSVYGIVYTVDFGYEVDGQLYEYTLPGGGSIGLRGLVEALHIHEGGPQSYDDVDGFIADVQNVTFSDPSLVWIQQVPMGEAKTLRDILDEQGLQPEYTAETTEAQKAEWLGASYSEDWVLVSLKPFTTTEMLTIAMSDGTQRLVAVTDVQDAPLKPDPDNPGEYLNEVNTIRNPSGTTIDLIDYWFVDEYRNSDMDGARKGWPGWNDGWNFTAYNHDGTEAKNGDGQPFNWNNNYDLLRGYGNFEGINQGHAFKFTPAAEYSVLNGTSDTPNVDGNGKMNSYTGGVNPLPGLVKPIIGTDGYPVLTNDSNLGTDETSLNYLFDDSTITGKEKFAGVDHLLYVDEDGYYTFDSAEYWASFDRDSTSGNYKNFTLTPQDKSGTARGFWPFGQCAYWHGMHINTEFSMPSNGKVLNPKGIEKEMEFIFEGDDDTWIYIDGVLVGDGGGIHNKTRIDINYATGKVNVTGQPETTLRQLFLDSGKFSTTVAPEYADKPEKDPAYIENFFDGDTFKPNSYHTFDMFYLERGGGEANLYIHYNLVSTADFTGHKEYQGSSGSDILTRDQYKFDLIGLDGEYYFDANDNYALKPATDYPPRRAIMPAADANGAGTVESPRYTANVDEVLKGGSVHGQAYRTGATEDGNINFGKAVIAEELMLQYDNATRDDDPEGTVPTYRYLVKEVIPDDAVNFYGQAYKDRTDEQRQFDIWYTKDDVMYDARTHYMTGTITRWESVDAAGHTHVEYGLSKRYFTDGTFTTQVAGGESFIDFDNRYVKPLEIDVLKKEKKNNPDDPDTPLAGATFKLTHVEPSVETQEVFDENGDIIPGEIQVVSKWVETPGGLSHVMTTGSDGVARFPNIPAGFYVLEETKPPVGYQLQDRKWLYAVVRADKTERDPDTNEIIRRYSELEAYVLPINLDGSENYSWPMDVPTVSNFTVEQEVENEHVPPFSFEVEKQWDGVNNANQIEHSEVNVTIRRYKLVDKGGTLNIVKSGIPSGARVEATYLVEKEEDNGTFTEVARYTVNTGWNESGTTIVQDLPLPMGNYRVVEIIDSDDDRYEHSHGTDVVETPLTTDGQEQTATFTSSYTRKEGSIHVTAHLDDAAGENPDTSNIWYVITDSDGNEVGRCNYATASSAGGYTLDHLLVGNYTVTETEWPESQSGASIVHNHGLNDSGQAEMLVTVHENATAEAEFNTAYQTGSYVQVYTYNINFNNQQITEQKTLAAGPTFISDSYVEITFICQPQQQNNGTLRVGTGYGDSSFNSYITWADPNDPNHNQTATVRIPRSALGTPDENGIYSVYVGRDWRNDVIHLGGFVPPKGSLTVKANLTDNGFTVNPSDVAYTIWDSGNNQVGSCTFSEAQAGYTINDLDVGRYKVIESNNWPTVEGAEIIHNPAANNGEVSIEKDIVEGGPTMFEFSTEYRAPARGTLVITSSLDTSGYTGTETIDPSAVRYAIYDANNNLVQGDITYAQVSNGFQLDVAPGQYKVVETGWPTVSGTRQTHPNGTEITSSISDGGTTTFAFSTVYADWTPSTVSVEVYRCKGNAGGYDGGSAESLGTFSVTAARALLTFWANNMNGNRVGVYTRWNGQNANSRTESVTWGSETDGDLRKGTAEIEIPDGVDAIRIYISDTYWQTPSDVIGDTVSVEAMRGRSSMQTMSSASRALSSALTRQLDAADEPAASTETTVATRAAAGAKAPGDGPGGDGPGGPGANHEQHSSDSGTSPVDTFQSDTQKYVLDTDYSRVVELRTDHQHQQGTQFHWSQTIDDEPAYDSNGNKYYYFIDQCDETRLPPRTTLTIPKNASGGQVLAYQNDTYDTPNPLVVHNSVGESANLGVTKVDENDLPIEGARFRLLEGEDDHVVTSPQLTANDPTESVDFDSSDSSFTIPAGGITLSQLEPSTYKLEELVPPAGYVIGTKYTEFEVGHDGKITGTNVVTQGHGPNAVYTIKIENQPGQELPHSGGPGTIVGAIAGVCLIAFGALALRRDRTRCAKARHSAD